MRTNTFEVTGDELQRLMSGIEGTDLERIPSSTAMRIVRVTTGSIAARWGAQNGDTIESLNDEPLSSVAAAYEAAARAMRTKEIVIKGRRGEEPYTTILRVR